MRLAMNGFSVFPIHPDSKIPVLPWKANSTASETLVEGWWGFYPDDNIGINTGESGLLVVDLDSDDALAAWDKLWDTYEEESFDDGRFPIVETRRGWHIYMDDDGRRFKNTSSKLGTGIDTRGSGGMVLAPGSRVKGVEYELVVGGITDIATIPAWLGRKLSTASLKQWRDTENKYWRPPSLNKSERELARWCRKIETAAFGEQNTTINVAAYILRNYIPPLEIEDVRGDLLDACERGHHPRERARATIESGLGFHA